VIEIAFVPVTAFIALLITSIQDYEQSFEILKKTQNSF